MQQNKQERNNYTSDVISIRELLNILLVRKLLIVGLTIFVTVLAFLYTNNTKPNYQASSSFISPSEGAIAKINKLPFISENKKSLYAKYLNVLSSKEFQKKAFIDGDFLTKFNPDNNQIDNLDGFINGVISSIKIIRPTNSNDDYRDVPYSISMEGSNAIALEDYLNSIIKQANSKTLSDIFSLNQLKTSIRLDEISIERELFLKMAKKERLNSIERIKEKNIKEIKFINNKIDRLRITANIERLNEITALKESIFLAESLGIVDNNFYEVKNTVNNTTSFTLLNEFNDIPDWYLYGKDALKEKLNLLEDRENDDPFIPELTALKNQLFNAKNNIQLSILNERQDDSPFIVEVTNLDIEKIKLEYQTIKLDAVNVTQLYQNAASSIKSSNKKLLVVIAFIGSFILSIFLALMLGIFKAD